MKINDQTKKKMERLVRKVAENYPIDKEATVMTDIHLRVAQDTGETVAFDDDDNEIASLVVEQWIDNKDDDFYSAVAKAFTRCLENMRDIVSSMSIIKPFSFVLEDEDKEHIAKLFVADNETVILDADLMEGLDKDLDDFFNKLMKEK